MMMKLSQLAVLGSIFGTVTAFVPPSKPRTPIVPAAVDASILDTSSFPDPAVLAGAAGAVIAAAGAAIGIGKGAGPVAAAGVDAPEPPAAKVDVGVPYDAAAALAYAAYAESSSEDVDYAEFRTIYETQMAAEVKAKWLSGPVAEKRAAADAMRAELTALEGELEALEGGLASATAEAAESEGRIRDMFGMPPPSEAATPAASSGIELWSVDYDAAARLAYEAAGSEGDFDLFRTKYLADASAMVAEKGLI